ncbi:hypothetical protein LOD99_5795 [Oopsacas minuta]|uniref:Mediator of RNA polymerase II transcription subunit 13 n=1 Tax=Oopsacas minuta TaxID=111878 RepID=A0AAV7JPX1_9METZ|nr:hypothetical protein LOD99_5795 [Oopsacas minuta]
MNTTISHTTSSSHNSSLPYYLQACQSPARTLMDSQMNVLKLVEIKSGLKWHNYRGKPLGSSLPGESGVLISFSRCLSAGLACCYHAFQFRTMDGPLQNATRLVVFSFNQENIDVASKIESSLTAEGTGDADDGLTEEVKKLLDLAIQNLIERMLHSDGYITLGTWFARSDPSTHSIYIYRLNYFNQESSYWVCATVSVMEVSSCLRLLSSEELSNVDSLKGRKVVLSPCGLSGQLTGRAYTEETQGSLDLLSEWKLVYPNMFITPVSPPLLEVVIAGVCMKYPTQFLLSYSSQEHARTQRRETREISHHNLSVKDIIDGVYNLDMQNSSSEILPWNKRNLDFRIASISSGTDTPSYVTQDRRLSLAPAAPSPQFMRVTSSDIMDLTSTPTQSNTGADGTYPGRKKSNSTMPRPPKTLKILKQESMEDNTAWRLAQEAKLKATKSKSNSTVLWFNYTLPDSLSSLESLYSTQDCILEYGYGGLQHPGGMYGGRLGPIGKTQAVKNKKGRSRTRSEKSSTSRTPTTRKKRLSKSEAKKQQTPTGREDKPMDLTITDKEMGPPVYTPTSTQSNCSAFNMPPPEQLHCNDISDVRAPVLDVLVPTPTTLNTQFNMPEPSLVFTPGPYTHGGISSPSTETTPQQPLSQGQPKHPVFPPTSTHATYKNQMPDQIFETDDEDSIPIDSLMSRDVDGNKNISNHYTKTSNPLLLEESHSILTPPSIGKNGQSPKAKPPNALEIFELVPDSFSPNYGLEYHKHKGLGEYKLSYQETPITNNRHKLSLCRDVSTTDNIITNIDDVRSISSSRGLIETTGSMDTSYLPNTPSTVTILTKSVSDSNSIKKEISETLRKLPNTDTQLETPPKTEYPETHALLLNIMLLDPQQTFPEQIPTTPFPTPLTAHTSQPNHFTFPPSSYAPPDELSLSLDNLLSYGTSRDHSLHTLEFSEDRLVGNFPVHYFHTYDQLVLPHHADTGWNQVGNTDELRIQFAPKRITHEPLTIESTSVPIVHPRALSMTLELIQRHCLSTSPPQITHKNSITCITQPDGVIDLYERGTLANTLRECCRLYADNIDEDDTIMDITAVTDINIKQECSSPGINTDNTVNASQTETEGEASQNLDSDDGQQDDEEDPISMIELDFSLDIDNDGSWLTTLQQSSDNRTAKLIRKFHSSLPKSMLKRSISPLTWSELFQILSPVQSSDTRHHSPATPQAVPVPTLLIGQESDWIEIAPYDVINWDKLSLYPYAPREDVHFIVVSPTGEKIENRVCHYFKQLSLVYQDSELGRHRPVTHTNSRTDGIYTYTPAHTSSLYLDVDSLSNIKNLLTSVILTQLSSMMSPHDKQRRDPDIFHSSLLQHSLYTNTSISEGESSPSLVLYILNTGATHQQIDIMRVFAEALVEHPLSQELSRRLVLYVIPAQDVITQRRISSQNLRAICLDVFSKCRYFSKSSKPSRGMSFVEDMDDWREKLYPDKSPQPSIPPLTVGMYRPPYILAKHFVMRPDPVLPNKKSLPPSNKTDFNRSDFELGQKNTNTLFCGYCVSTGNSYLLVACCDSQGSLLDSAVLGLRYPGKPDGYVTRDLALRDMWRYILSLLSQTVLTWHVVITRLGRPSNEELRDLKRIVRDLDSAQTELTKGCTSCTCKCNTHMPSIQSVHVLSFQPEKNFRVLLNDNSSRTDTHSNTSTYILVQPGPNYMDTYTQMDDSDLKDNIVFFSEMPAGGQLQSADEGVDEMNIFREMDGIDGLGLPTPGALADAVDNYHAVGYVLSSAEPGPLPAAFWGEKRERNAFFRAQLHGEFYLDIGEEARSKHLSYEESLKKILERFDALSWLVLSPETGGRVSALPLHLYTLCNLYHQVRWLNTKQI